MQLPSTQQVAHQDFRNRFKIVKVETTEPLKRGRWTCFDFVDKPAAKEKIAAAATAAEAGDKKAVNTAAGTGNIPAAAAKVVTSRPASSMARELGAVHETTAGDEGVRHVDAGTTQQHQQQQRQAVVGSVTVGGGGGGGGGVNFVNLSAGGGGGFATGPPPMTGGGGSVQQLQQQQQHQQQPQASPPVTSLPQVWRMFLNYIFVKKKNERKIIYFLNTAQTFIIIHYW